VSPDQATQGTPFVSHQLAVTRQRTSTSRHLFRVTRPLAAITKSRDRRNSKYTTSFCTHALLPRQHGLSREQRPPAGLVRSHVQRRLLRDAPAGLRLAGADASWVPASAAAELSPDASTGEFYFYFIFYFFYFPLPVRPMRCNEDAFPQRLLFNSSATGEVRREAGRQPMKVAHHMVRTTRPAGARRQTSAGLGQTNGRPPLSVESNLHTIHPCIHPDKTQATRTEGGCPKAPEEKTDRELCRHTQAARQARTPSSNRLCSTRLTTRLRRSRRRRPAATV
jgi:hypothetical protein